MTKSIPQTIDPRKLKPHPALAGFPELPLDQFQTLLISVRTHGILQPLIVKGDEVLDGRHRLQAACEVGLGLVPIVERADIDPLDCAIESAISRRQLTKSGIVLLLWEKHPSLALNRGERKGGRKKLLSETTVEENPSYRTLSERYGVQADYFSKIALIWDAIGDDADAWAELRRSILVDEASLPRLYAGVGGKLATKGGKKTATNYFSTCRTGLVSIREAFKNWKKVPLEKRTEIKKLWDELQRMIPGDLE